MKAKDLISIINSELPEQVILGKLKAKLANSPRLLKMKPWNSLTPLEAAIMRGYTSIVKFLIEEKKTNLWEENDDQTPLDCAIDLDRTEIALYIISKMKGYPIDKYIIRFLYAIVTSRFPIVKAILAAEPQIMSYGTPILLEQSVLKASDEIVMFLLEHGAKPMILAPTAQKYSPYYASLDQARHLIIAAMLEAGASPMQCTSLDTKAPFTVTGNATLTEEEMKKCLADLSLTPLQIVANSSKPTIAKRESANVLLAAGAGLDKNAIPSAIFQLYNLNRNHIAASEFIIIAEQKDKDNQWKKKVITKITQIKERIFDPNWRFNTEQLNRSCVYLESLSLPQIDTLRNILSGNSENLEKSALSLHQANPIQSSSSWTPARNIELLSAYDLQVYLPKCYQHFTLRKESLFNALSALEAGSQQIDISIAFQNTFEIYSHLIDISSKNKHGNDICISPVGGIEPTLVYESHLIVESVDYHLNKLRQTDNKAGKNHSEIQIYSALNQQCKFILKKHLAFLTSTINNAIYDALHDVKATLDINLVTYYYENHNYSLALYYIINAQSSLSQRNNFKNRLQGDLTRLQLRIHIWMAAIYHKQGCYKEATVELCKARNSILTYKNELILDSAPITFETMLQSVEIDMPSKDGITFYEELQRHVDLLSQEHETEAIFRVSKEFNEALDSMKRRYLIKIHNEFSDKMINIGFLITAPIIGSLNVFLTHEEYTTLSATAIKLLTCTEGVTYIIGSDRIDFNESFLLKTDIHVWVNKFIKAMNSKPNIPSYASIQKIDAPVKDPHEETLLLAEKVSSFTISKQREKVKTRPAALSVSNEEEKNRNPDNKQLTSRHGFEKSEDKPAIDKYGFTQLEGYSPAIPVVSHYIPDETLFLAIPNNDPAFLPFLNLSYDRQSNTYHEIRSIAEKGHNQQGVKLGSQWLTFPNQPPAQIDIARVKVLGADGKGKLRATGVVQQKIQSSDNRLRKLYVIDTLTDKKKEKRSKSLN